MKKIFIADFHEESNSFNPALAGMGFFEAYGVCFDEEVLNPEGRPVSTVKYGVKALKDAGYNLVGGVVMRSGSAGPVDSTTVDYFIKESIKRLKMHNDLDGVLLTMHGATTSNKSEDVCGDVIEAYRKAVGENVIISVTFDLHANVTEKILKNADYISSYQTYPHLDLGEVGARGAEKLIKHFTCGKRYVASASVPIIAPAHAYTTGTRELKKLMDKAFQYKKDGVIDDYCVFQVQPWLDVSEMSARVVITSKSEETSINVANELIEMEFDLKEDLQGENLVDVDFVIERAIKNDTGKPVILVDSADSPNAGACGDSAYVLEKLLPYKNDIRCAVAVSDVSAVDKAFEVGVGGVSDFTIGATVAPKLSSPVTIKGAVVKSLHDGSFYMYGPQERGSIRNVGKTAILQLGKIYIHLSYNGLAEGDKNFYASFGIDPELCDLVSVKACTSFRAGYEKFSAEIYNTSTKGAAGPVLQKLPFENRPKPMYPFEEISKSDIVKAKIYRR